MKFGYQAYPEIDEASIQTKRIGKQGFWEPHYCMKVTVIVQISFAAINPLDLMPQATILLILSIVLTRAISILILQDCLGKIQLLGTTLKVEYKIVSKNIFLKPQFQTLLEAIKLPWFDLSPHNDLEMFANLHLDTI